MILKCKKCAIIVEYTLHNFTYIDIQYILGVAYMELIRKKMKLGDVLVNSNTITEDQLRRALELQKGSNKKLGEVHNLW